MTARTTPRLSLDVLATLPSASRPLLDPRQLRAGVVHVGFGAFHRAHQAVYTEAAAAASTDPVGTVVVVPGSAATASHLLEQDGLFSVTELSGDPGVPRVVASTTGVVRGWDPDAVASLLLDPGTSVVTLTVTEKGYRRDLRGGLDVTDPALADDLAGGRPTAVGLLARALDARFRANGAPLTVVSCDNLARNGEVTSRVVREYVERSGWQDAGAVLQWLQTAVTFPSTVVDQIVPAATPGVLDSAAQALGVRDELAVAGEPFRSWVLQDDFAAARPAWELAGARFVDDVAPHQLMKLRLLNGSHSALAYLGLAAGCATVDEAVATGWGSTLVQRLGGEVAPTLPVPQEQVREYCHALGQRFANPGVRHRLTQIGDDGAAKVAERWFTPLRELRAARKPVTVLIAAVAAWAHATRPDGEAQLFGTTDPLSAALADCWAHERGGPPVVAGLLRTAGADDLAEDHALVDAVAGHLPALARGVVEL
ncbi:mannitol dehydrogenase family protein [Kineococcus radiotolerans]|uniref:Mannitol dehydrogenase domain n=1 Tax=Kineococcus radiotolerans (strain ATCC BAA-149 / DSM 14245 / SRS30216) TaxID=266940 RepID=A6W9X4_KINRD|nr:mannitol dehydrogenase family protein [Kineococcus radiotolerans]ABS03613.1 Mannitol dehydrogenase domain [Kineococcus radiotolerans SRS30216 = ATCC BAA-149]